MSLYIFIVNPVAGNGRGYKTFKKLTKTQIYQSITSKPFITKYAGHAEEIVRKLETDVITAIIVIGGDGTMHEVMNGLQDRKVPISFIPGGSGNDFARGSGIKGNPQSILKRIVENQESLTYWNSKYQMDDNLERELANSIGFGFDAEIAERANQSQYKKLLNLIHLGTLSYVIALIQVIFTFKPFKAEIIMDGKKKIIDNCWMVTIGNHEYYGGGMKIIPTATIQPTILPILTVHGISKWKVLGLFITVFTGKHIRFKEVDLFQAEYFSINIKEPVAYQVDGQTGITRTCRVVKNKQAIQIKGSTFS